MCDVGTSTGRHSVPFAFVFYTANIGWTGRLSYSFRVPLGLGHGWLMTELHKGEVRVWVAVFANSPSHC